MEPTLTMRASRLPVQQRQQRAHQQHGREHIGLHDACDLVFVLILEPCQLTDTGVVDQQICPARQRLGRGKHGCAALGSVQVGRDGAHIHFRRGPPQFCRQRRQPAGIATDQQHGLTARRQRVCNGAADAARGTGQHDPQSGLHAASTTSRAGIERNRSP
jgi:hypothetical protein